MRKTFKRFQSATVDFIINSPAKTLGAFFFLTFLLGLGLAQLKTDFTYKVWYNDNDPLMLLYQNFEKNFGNDDSVIIALSSEEGVFTQDILKLIADMSEDLYQVDDIIRVDSILNFHDIEASGDQIDIEPLVPEDSLSRLSPVDLKNVKKKALSNEILRGTLVDHSGTFTIINAQVRPAHDNPPDYQEITAQVEELLKKYRSRLPRATIMATGPVILTDAFRAITISDMALLIPVLYTIFTIILIYLFRRVSGVLLPYVAITFTTIMMLGTMGFLNLSVNTLTAAAPTILLTVALADAIHILTVYYLSRKNNFSHSQALRRTLNKNFYPTLLTTLTTALGFLSFFDAKVKPVAQLGVAVGFGAVYAWFASYALLGPLLAFLPKFEKGERGGELEREETGIEKEIPPAKRSYQLADWILKHRRGILIVALVFGGAGLYFSKNLVVNMDPAEQFPKDHPVIEAYDLIRDKLGHVASIEMFITSSEPEGAKDPRFLRKVELLENWLNNQPYVKKTLSINDYVKKINQAFHGGDENQYEIPPTSEHVAQELLFYSMGLPPENSIENRINAQRDAIRLTINWDIKGSLESNKKFEIINKKAKDFGLQAKVTGKTPLFHDLTPYIVDSFLSSFSIALVTITLALMFIFQSFKLGVFAMIPSVLPLMIGSGLYALSGHQVDMGTVLLASVCLGIAVDDSVHFMFAYRRLMAQNSLRETLANIISNIFPSLFNTTLLLAVGFSVFILGRYEPNAKFGVSAAVILVFALISDFLVLPAMLAVFDRKNKNVEK